jgi:hypothetical protein
MSGKQRFGTEGSREEERGCAERHGPGKAGAEVLGKAAFGIVTAAKSPRDTLVLWHLLQLDQAAGQAGVPDRLLELAGPPAEGKATGWSREAWLQHLQAVAWRSPK